MARMTPGAPSETTSKGIPSPRIYSLTATRRPIRRRGMQQYPRVTVMPPAQLRTPVRGHSFNCPIFDDYFGGAAKPRKGRQCTSSPSHNSRLLRLTMARSFNGTLGSDPVHQDRRALHKLGQLRDVDGDARGSFGIAWHRHGLILDAVSRRPPGLRPCPSRDSRSGSADMRVHSTA